MLNLPTVQEQILMKSWKYLNAAYYYYSQPGGYGGHDNPELPGKLSGMFTLPEKKSPHALHISSLLHEFLPIFTFAAMSLPTFWHAFAFLLYYLYWGG